MIDSIGETIVRVVEPLVPVYLSEAETESYPYAVYELQTLSDAMVEGLLALNADRAWAVQVTSQSKSCTEGVWVLTTNLQINQLG